MFERSELRSSREDRKENGVKNLNGAKPFPKTFIRIDITDLEMLTRYKQNLTFSLFSDKNSGQQHRG
jgi:hypothetical protein